MEYPIAPRENMKLVLEHKTPLWVPNMFADINFCLAAPADAERPPFPESGKDWFGTTWEYVEVVGGQMASPNLHICPDPSDWKEKLVFPDLDEIDFAQGREEMAPTFDPQKMTMYIIQNGMFERLLDISDASEVFVWMATEPDDVIEYANAMADFKIRHVDKVIDEWGLVDFFALSDDWGTQKAPFISPAMWKQIFYEPTKRIADHIKRRGYYVNCHSCGKIDQLVPFIADFADLWEGQYMNDHVAHKRDFGDRLAFTIAIDPARFSNPNITENEVAGIVRETIDAYGEGGGMVMMTKGPNSFVDEIITRETFEYSMKKYAAK